MQLYLDNSSSEKEKVLACLEQAREGEESVGKSDKRIPDENKSRLGAAGSDMESKKPRGKDTEPHTIRT